MKKISTLLFLLTTWTIIFAQDTILPDLSIKTEPILQNANNNYFGFSIAQDGEYLVIGAPGYNSWQGCVYIFHKEDGQWKLKTKLYASDGQPMDGFGEAVAIKGSTIAIGAYGKNIFTGCVYIFEQKNDTTWEEVQRIDNPNNRHRDYFGSAIALNNKYLAIGAWGDDKKSTNAGAVYIYQKNGDEWIFQTKIYASDADYRDKFGYSLAMNDQILAVGAYSNDDINISSGTVYLYSLTNNFNEIKILRPADAGKYWQFGRSIAISDNTIAIGSFGADNFIGAAYIFTKNPEQPWDSVKQTAKISPFDSIPDAQFGYAVSINSNTLVVGAPLSKDTGFVYVYNTSDNWKHINFAKKLKATNTNAKDFFGRAVAITENNIIIGAYKKDDSKLGTNSGSVYTFDLTSLEETNIIQPTYTLKSSFDYFGYSIDTYDDYAIIGAPGENNSKGAVYIYHYHNNTWERIAKLTNTYPYGGRFGQSVAIYKDVIVIGSPYYESTRGAVFLFTKPTEGWHDMTTDQGVKITAPERHYYDYFGQAIDIDDSGLVISAPGYDNNKGRLFLFKPNSGSWRNGFSLEKEIYPPDLKEGDQLGYSVKIYDTLIIAGVPGLDSNLYNQGAIFIFSTLSSNNSIIKKIQPIGISKNSYFGNSIDFDGKNLIVGAYKENTRGSAYLIDLSNFDSPKITKIQDTGLNYNAEFGREVLLAGDKIIISAPRYNNSGILEQGTIYVFDTQNLKPIKYLTSRTTQPFTNIGWSIAFNGNYILTGSIGSNYNNGLSVGEIFGYKTFYIEKNNEYYCNGSTVKIIAHNNFNLPYKWQIKYKGLDYVDISQGDLFKINHDTLSFVFTTGMDSSIVRAVVIDNNKEIPATGILVTSSKQKPVLECIKDTTIYTTTSYTIQDSLFGLKHITSHCPIDSVTNSLTLSSSLKNTSLFPGTYNILWSAIDKNGNIGSCTFKLNIVMKDPFSVYPNPAHESINIVTLSVPMQIQIIDNSGKIIINKYTDKTFTTISISDLKPGVYTIRIYNNNTTSIQKIIKY